jgi:hypothetical protein
LEQLSQRRSLNLGNYFNQAGRSNTAIPQGKDAVEHGRSSMQRFAAMKPVCASIDKRNTIFKSEECHARFCNI